MYDLLLKGAHVVDPLNGVNGVNDVAVEGGKIAAVGPDLTGPAREVIDVSDMRVYHCRFAERVSIQLCRCMDNAFRMLQKVVVCRNAVLVIIDG